ncbi:hypothetical protein [Flavilitoribacter nigricans]|uniref:Uncharacterized protein n=1 Tax=Flavilitoribacter nigricans (strain ATCC 23147 / DSM 23189 / NBRC 102662 / NCIMB 1420 / SS-2) TaxID=1122177 RepID=A0A2D0MZP9_FLAN2|nr:hypothetical protein [Flavilitoribacter nigricans]PHN01369.1 hypothetical protein CRP01_37525 [Flavilitoribacter nigricans DSM 23189 = NBRC 102662]
MTQTIKYGIVGFSRNQFDQQAAQRILQDLFQRIRQKHPSKNIEIVSGYTNSGVPKIAYELSGQFGFTTVGFSARQALRVRSGVYPVDKVILKGERFGDESKDFIRYIDALIRIGGGKQSRQETDLFKTLHAEKPMGSILKEYEVDWYGKN